MMNWKLFLLASLLVVHCTIAKDAEEAAVEEDDEEEISPEPETVEEEEENKESEQIPYSTPHPLGNYYIAEHFDDREGFSQRWIKSEAKKDGAEESIAKYNGKWDVEAAQANALNGDLGLVLKSKAHHHAISSMLEKSFLFDNKPFILQYEVQFQNGQECGGAYLKLLSQVPDSDLASFHDKTPYTIMFGPDKCGNDHKLHFIFRHRNPKNGSFEEKHWKKSGNVPKLEDVFKDKKPHLFTLIVNPDNSFEVQVDKKSVHKGSLLEDFSPPVNPPSEIDDPSDKRPEDWDDREKISDPNAKKPDEWDEDAPRQIPDPNANKPDGWLDDEPELIPDPSAEKPSDWDEDMDGEWEPPLISNTKCESVGCGEWKAPMMDNPKFKGKWRPPLIDNPNYKGKWKPKRIGNPDFFEDKYPYKMTPISAVGFELWSMVDSILFDNILITDDLYVADHWAENTWALKKELADRESDGVLLQLVKYTNKHPWLWAVYVVVIGLPVVLFISFCCTSPTPKDREAKRAAAAAAKAKKTDAQTPDDPVGKESKNVEKRTFEEKRESPEKLEKQEKGHSSDRELSEERERIQNVKDAEEEEEEEQEDDDDEEVKEEEEEEIESMPTEEEAAGGDSRRSPRRRTRARKD